MGNDVILRKKNQEMTVANATIPLATQAQVSQSTQQLVRGILSDGSKPSPDRKSAHKEEQSAGRQCPVFLKQGIKIGA